MLAPLYPAGCCCQRFYEDFVKKFVYIMEDTLKSLEDSIGKWGSLHG
jgi:hypothetical protein